MFQKLDPKTMPGNVFDLIGDQWMLITAGTRDHSNAMTASWGGLGVLWNKPVATCYIRPQRYTYEFVERESYFTLAFFAPAWRKELALCGAKSGREIDKVNQCGFSLAYAAGDAPYYQEADLVLVCRKLYYDDLKPDHFLDPAIEGNYPARDYHRMYIGEIVEVLQRIEE